MGTRGNGHRVVDSSARILGVRDLRVVDNSASPFAVPRHPQATIYMPAEKIAHLTREGGQNKGATKVVRTIVFDIV